MSGRSLAVLGVPSSAGSRQRGLELAPSALRSEGLLEALAASGVAVADHGDLAVVASQPDPAHPRERNLEAVCEVARAVAEAVRRFPGGGVVPLVLGGDCTITIGVIAGLLQRTDVGLMYFDGDLDLNTPQTTPSGFYDGMVMSHVLGGGSTRLAHVGPRHPLLPEPKVAFVGYNAGCGSVDPPELETLERVGSLRYPLEQLREAPIAVARLALAELGQRVEGILVHFDVDVSDVPAVDFPHPGALSWMTAVEVLREFLASPQCAGLVITEFNPARDPDGSIARQIVAGVASAFGRASAAS